MAGEASGPGCQPGRQGGREGGREGLLLYRRETKARRGDGEYGFALIQAGVNSRVSENDTYRMDTLPASTHLSRRVLVRVMFITRF